MFATRNPTDKETNHIRALMSTFRDGSGNQSEPDGTTRASWREIERCIAEVVLGPASENKHIFDVIAPDSINPSIFYGLSIKSKELGKKEFLNLSNTGKVYMEIANSPAKFWADVTARHGYTERDFNQIKYPEQIGNTILTSVQKWHLEGKQNFEFNRPGKILDLNNSRYVCVSYSKENDSDDRLYQIHSFPLIYKDGIKWEYKSNRCLTGLDPDDQTESLFDWYGSSGGQLKYYPRAMDALYKSDVFRMLKPPSKVTLTDKAKLYFPREF
jgi:hypothetical protein